MACEPLKGLSTKAPQHVPAEFEQVFVQHGWLRANYLFGKRPTTRYFTYLGPDRLRAARAAHLHAEKIAKEAQSRPKWVTAR